ncbi:hypothetical protein AGMMS49545_23670 [Betaproteobacteria bacterium]|nr:hypothetical protein AGMMS49545_23670 [Betaproteobacteria bacterium]
MFRRYFVLNHCPFSPVFPPAHGAAHRRRCLEALALTALADEPAPEVAYTAYKAAP